MGMTYEITEMENILVVSIKGNPGVDDIKHILDQIRNESGYSHRATPVGFSKFQF